MTEPTPRLLTLVAELTYSCRLRCVYCSNPTQINERRPALRTTDWLRVIDDAAALGALHVHFTGGEPLLNDDLEALVRRAREQELYTNLITSGVPLTRARLVGLVEAGLDHVQVSLQGTSRGKNLLIAGVDTTARKVLVAQWVKELGLPLTINIVVHRHSVDELEALLRLAESFEPYRIELANAQYLGWALVNRDALLPSVEQLAKVRQLAALARTRLMGKTDVVTVLPDYYADRPRGCMSGWARHYVVVTPDGLALPCHAARDLPGLDFDDVRTVPLSTSWRTSPGLRRYRGVDWLPTPCRDCAAREKDFGGCRCQAFALTGDSAATDPACQHAPSHPLVLDARSRAARAEAAPLILRRAPKVNSAVRISDARPLSKTSD